LSRIAIEQPSELDLNTIQAALTTTYWSPGITREVVARACAHSLCAVARDEAGGLIGFARLVTDHATFAWLCDVFVLAPHQGRGLARALVTALMQHESCLGLRRWLLATRDAHGVYAPLGFAPLDTPDRFMHIKRPAPYGEAAG